MANSAKRQRRRWDAYAFLGVRPQPTVRGVFGDPKARVITLLRRSKKRSAAAAAGCSRVGTIAGSGECAICPAATCGCCSSSRFGASIVGVAAKVKRERLEFLSDNPFYTKRFTYYVGRRCRTATIKHVAEELHLDWDSVKTLEMQYMRAQLAKAGTPGPKAIGIDEISIRKGHTYRIVVSDLIRRRPIWFGGEDRSEANMAMFYEGLGKKQRARIRMAVMDMWKPFRNATTVAAPQAAILFDKFHIMRHLGEVSRQGTQGRVRAAQRQGSPLHQRSAVQPAVAAREPELGGTPVAQDAAGGQQAFAHGVSAQGIVRPALGLRT